jgi:hypothetical protein
MSDARCERNNEAGVIGIQEKRVGIRGRGL